MRLHMLDCMRRVPLHGAGGRPNWADPCMMLQGWLADACVVLAMS